MDGIEYKNFPFDLKGTSADNNYFYFEGYAAIFDTNDRCGDRILRGAFKESLTSIPVKILWQHQSWEPLGVPEKLLEDDKGLFTRAKLPKNDFLVKNRVIPQMKIGSVDSLSIGYRVRDSHWITEDDEDIYIISKASLYEISPVSIPMHPEAGITGIKAATGFRNLPLAKRDQKWSRKIAIQNIRENTNSLESPSSDYRKYFMWYDKDNTSNFGSYKLPYADWVDGEFKAVPRALIAIKAAIGGARGGVDIPDSDKSRILTHVDRYLSKLEESDKSFILSDVEDIETREDFNLLLKDIGLFSKKAREHLSSFFPSKSKESNINSLGDFTKTIVDLMELY